MKVNIGPYVNWIGPYQIADMLFFWQEKYPIDDKIEERWDYKLKDKFGRWLADTWVNNVCNWIHKNLQQRKVKIKIDRYDTWSLDHTLALVAVPLLKQLRDTKHGSPFVDDEDVPEELKSTSAPHTKNEWDTDDNHHKRWDWVLDEMIWAFEQHIEDDAESQFHSGDHDIYWQKVDTKGDPIDDKLYKIGDDKGESDEKTLWQMVKGPNDTHVFDKEGWEAWSARKRNGFRLFGKYYQSLWD